MIRFVHLFNYADGVSIDDGESWYLGEHVPQVKKLSNIVAYRSWRGLETPFSYPSPGIASPPDQFVRRSELWFDSPKSCQQAVISNPALWTPSEEGVPGFREFECMFISKEPQYNLLQDAPQEQYKYMTMPLMWPRGRPQVEDTDDLVVLCYYFNYRPEISIVDGEDWYIGHHTREGKQLPGVKHYRTWQTIRVPEEPDSLLNPNRWFRMTELGMVNFDAYRKTMVDTETRIRFTPSPLSRVIGEWINIFIKLELIEDLLA